MILNSFAHGFLLGVAAFVFGLSVYALIKVAYNDYKRKD